VAVINLYYKKPPLGYKYFPGDRYVFNALRSLVSAKKASGLDKVFVSLCKGFDELSIHYTVNLPFNKVKPGEPVVVLGLGELALKGYKQPNPIIAGIGLMTHPYDWPTLMQDYPVAKYLQHSAWVNEIYVRYYGRENCGLWPAGIDTIEWSPQEPPRKKKDFLIYNKIRWDHENKYVKLRNPILKKLDDLGYTYHEIIYGQYAEADFRRLLQQSKAMIFLCEHESQGIACCEALSMNVPVLAWDQGFWLDPNRFAWNDPVVPATSVPFFDERCGMTFVDFEAFNQTISSFYSKVQNNEFAPREYILCHLTLKKKRRTNAGDYKQRL